MREFQRGWVAKASLAAARRACANRTTQKFAQTRSKKSNQLSVEPELRTHVVGPPFQVIDRRGGAQEMRAVRLPNERLQNWFIR
jgi:hypothetical protein